MTPRTAFYAGFLSCALLVVAVLIGIHESKADSWVTATVRSYHMERGKGYEEQNYGLGYERSLFGNWRYSVGVYRNSERRDSAYGAGVYCPPYLQSANWRVCAMAGLVTGYESGIAPLAGGALSYEGKTWGLNLLMVPSAKGDITKGVIALQLKRRF